eukprot:7736068-Karenia_brevis.AAC.1
MCPGTEIPPMGDIGGAIGTGILLRVMKTICVPWFSLTFVTSRMRNGSQMRMKKFLYSDGTADGA